MGRHGWFRAVEGDGRVADRGRDPPGPALLVSRNTAGVYPLYVTARLPLPMERALRLVPPAVGTHRPDGPDATVVEVGGPDDGLAGYLLGLGIPLRVLSPDEVRQALLRRTRELQEDNGDPRA